MRAQPHIFILGFLLYLVLHNPIALNYNFKSAVLHYDFSEHEICEPFDGIRKALFIFIIFGINNIYCLLVCHFFIADFVSAPRQRGHLRIFVEIILNRNSLFFFGITIQIYVGALNHNLLSAIELGFGGVRNC